MPRQRGLTLIDVLLGSALVALVVGLALPGFKLAEDTIATGSCRDRLERAADRALAGVLAVLRSGRVIPIDTGGGPPAVAVRRIIEGIDLADLSADDPPIFEADPVTLRFRSVREISEHVAKTDLNRDGDRSDSFALGVLEVVEGATVRPILARPLVLLALPGYAGDLDGDGAGDPLLVNTNDSVTVNIHLLDREENGRYMKTSVRANQKLRNREATVR